MIVQNIGPNALHVLRRGTEFSKFGYEHVLDFMSDSTAFNQFKLLENMNLIERLITDETQEQRRHGRPKEFWKITQKGLDYLKLQDQMEELLSK